MQSRDNSVISQPTQSIVDAYGTSWSIIGGQVAADGIVDASTNRVTQLAYAGGEIWQENTDDLWWSKAGAYDPTWSPPGGSPTNPLPQSSNNSVISQPDQFIVDASGATWTVVNGQVAVNGMIDAATNRVTELAYEQGTVWEENTDKLWWSKNMATGTWDPPGGTPVSPVQDGAQQTVALLLDGLKIGDPVSGFDRVPDNGLGVGPQFIVSTENAVIQWTDVVGGAKFVSSLTDFLSPLGLFTYPVDGRTIYDAASDRFIFSAADKDQSGNQHYLLAVTKDSNPNDGWNFQSFDPLDPKALIDQPTAATDGTSIYLSGSIDPSDNPGYQTSQMLVVGSQSADGGPGIFGGGSSSSSVPISLGSGGVYKQVAYPGGGDLAFARDSQTMTFKHIDPASQSIDVTSTVNLGPISSVGEQEFFVPTQGTTTPIDAEDQRVYGSAYSGGFLYATFQDLPPNGPDAGVPTAHWVKLDVRDPGAVALVAQGDVSGSQIGSGTGTFNSSIAVDGAGDVIINFTATSPSLVPTDYFVVHHAEAAEGAFSAPVEFKASAGTFVDPNATDFGTSVPTRLCPFSPV